MALQFIPNLKMAIMKLNFVVVKQQLLTRVFIWLELLLENNIIQCGHGVVFEHCFIDERVSCISDQHMSCKELAQLYFTGTICLFVARGLPKQLLIALVELKVQVVENWRHCSSLEEDICFVKTGKLCNVSSKLIL